MLTREELIKEKKKRKISVAQLSASTGIPAGTLAKIFSGATKNPRVDTVNALEQFFRSGHSRGDMESYDGIIPGKSMDFDHCTVNDGILNDGVIKGDIPDDSIANGTRLNYSIGHASSMLCERAVKYGAEPAEQGKYTVRNLSTMPEGVPIELINGVLYDMASASLVHNEIAFYIRDCFNDHIRSKKGSCRAILAPTDVYILNDDSNVFVPDLSVVCDKTKLKEKGIYGAPDFILEVLSPSTCSKDMNIKFNIYKKAGVRELWYIDPMHRILIRHVFSANAAEAQAAFKDNVLSQPASGVPLSSEAEPADEVSILGFSESAASSVFEDLSIDLSVLNGIIDEYGEK